MSRKRLSPWSLPPDDTALPPAGSRGGSWKRPYRLRSTQGGLQGADTFVSQDAPADDPDTIRFWRWVVVVLAIIAIVLLAAALFDALS